MRYQKFITVVACLAFCATTMAQHLPGDPEVRKGKLENGLTYYIRHNELPAQRAEFYLATNVGAIQEAPDQDGLAHFLEHMCFNGTKNFPDKGILNYLQSIGASFGGNVNASTGVEETVYMLNNIPLVNASVVDSCLLILHDYSHFVICDPGEIDKERGVILEEKRTRNDASWRLNEKLRPYLYGDTKYAGCSVIGSEENLKNFKPESLVSFYRTWYRPDLQAVIVVGDVNVDEVEAKIKSVWTDIPAAESPLAKAVIAIPENTEPSIGILTDPEMPSTSISFYWKSGIQSEEANDTAPFAVETLIKQVISNAMSERLSDIKQKPDSPVTQGSFSSLNVCETMNATALSVLPKEGQWKDAVTLACTEAEKLRRFGLSESEIERAKAEVLAGYESAANKADTRKNSEFVWPLINNFFDNHNYMAPKKKYSFVKGILPQLTASMINDVASKLITDGNFTVLYIGPEKEGQNLPTQKEIMDIIVSVRNSDIQKNEEREIAASFVDPATLAGSPVKASKGTVLGATEWTLKNGVKVVLLPTDYEKDKVSIKLLKKGGMNIIRTEDMPSFESNIWLLFQMNQGVSSFSAAEVKKMLSGKNVSAQAFISQHSHGVSASSSKKDIETAFQLAYLSYCDPRFDEGEFNQAVQMIKPMLGNLESMPQFQFQKKALEVLFNNPSRHLLINEEVLSKASVQTMEKVCKELYADASGLVALIVGDFDMEAVRPMVEKYIGSIPKGRKAFKWVDNKDGMREGTIEEDFSITMATPKVTVSQVYSLRQPFTAKLDVTMDALKYILNMIYTDTLREEEGGTYGAQVTVNAGRQPENLDLLEVDFETNPESADHLRELAKSGFASIAKDGPTDDYFDKAVKNLQKQVPEDRVRNSYWMTGLEQWYFYGIDYIDAYESAIGDLKPQDIQNLAKALMESGNFIELIMRPEEKESNNNN